MAKAGGGTIEAYIRQAATARGIDPDVAVRVARSEGGLRDSTKQSDVVRNGRRETSYGPFQLRIGGGLGDGALRAGIDPRRENDWQRGVDYALNHAAKHGWGSWYGAAKVGLSKFAGITRGSRPVAVSTANAYAAGAPRRSLTAAQQAAAGLAAAGTLRKGATDAKTGGAVTRLQQQLVAVPGGPPVAVDGKYGEQTEAAVRAVEKQYNLPTRDRGVAGPQVQAALAGNERMRIVADTQARFGALAPGTPPGGPTDFSIADAGPPGQRLQAGTGVVTIPTGTGGGVASSPGGPVSTGGFPVQNAFFREPAIDNAGLTELVTGQKMTSPRNMYNAWAEAAIASGLAHQQQTADQTRRAALEWNKDEVWPSAPLSPLFSNADYEAATAKDDTRLGQGPAPELVRLAQEAASGGAPGGPAAAAGGRTPFPNIVTDFPGYVKRSMEVAMPDAQSIPRMLRGGIPGGPGVPPVASGPPAPSYDTRGVSAGLSSPNVGAANEVMQQVAARQAAAPPVSRFGTTDYFPENVSSSDYTTGVPGRTGNAPTGINNFGDIADAWRRIGGDVAGLFGGPPTSTATPQTSVPQGFAPIPPDVPESASPSPYPFSGVTAGGRIGAPQQQGSLGGYPTSLGGDLSRLGTPGERAEDVPGVAVGGFMGGGTLGRSAPEPSRPYEDFVQPDYGYRSFSSQPPPQVYPPRAPGGGFMPDPQSPARGQLWGGGVPSQQASLGGIPWQPTSLGGDLSRLGTPGERAEDVPGEAVGGALEDYLQAPVAGPPAPATVVPSGGAFVPGGAGVPFQSGGAQLLPAGTPPYSAGGIYGVNADPRRLDAGTLDASGGVPHATNPVGPPAAVTGRQLIGVPQVRPLSTGEGIGRFAMGAVPVIGPLLSAIAGSVFRGSLDNAQPYMGGQVTSYDRAAPNPYGGYTTGSSYSASPFTPAGSGWNAPNFDINPATGTGSGGPLYAYQPNGQGGGQFIDSSGRVHSY